MPETRIPTLRRQRRRRRNCNRIGSTRAAMGGLVRACFLVAAVVLTISTCTAFRSNNAGRDVFPRRATTIETRQTGIRTKLCAVGCVAQSPLFGNPRRTFTSFHHRSKQQNANLFNDSFAVVQKQWNRKYAFRHRLRNWKRRVSTAAFAVLIWCSATILVPPPIAHASSTSSTQHQPVTERLLQQTSPKVDDLIDRYVRQHMFDDDYSLADPISSTYREAFHDASVGRHPAALREIVAQVWQGKDKPMIPAAAAAAAAEEEAINIGRLLTTAVQALQTKVGLSETMALFVLAGTFVVAGPSAFLLGGMIIGGISKRNMNRLFKKRYGEDYTVDASVKKEEIVEAPDDDDDDEEDDDDDDDDNDEPEDKK